LAEVEVTEVEGFVGRVAAELVDAVLGDVVGLMGERVVTEAQEEL
jgi:hypothetical protein